MPGLGPAIHELQHRHLGLVDGRAKPGRKRCKGRADAYSPRPTSASLDYDAGTDSLDIRLRPEGSADNRILRDDVVLDFGIDGEPVGYDIQHASRQVDATADAPGYLHQKHAA